MKQVFEFLNYRDFLKHFYEEKKKKNPHFSHRLFLQKAGIKNTGFFASVVNGERNLSSGMLLKFTQALKLNVRETNYFQNLVLFNQAKNVPEKQKYYLILKTIGEMVDQKSIGSDTVGYFNQWYIPVIRELVCISDFNGDYSKLAHCLLPPISAKEAKNAIDFLLNRKMIRKGNDDRYTQITPALMGACDEATRTAIRNFNKKMLQLAQDAIDNLPREKRYIRGLTIGVSKQCYDVIQQEIEAFFDRLLTIVNVDGDAEEVYQLNLLLFPLSNIGRNKSVL
jgi:uncharacterized protein (TIGR02147 family)